MLVPCWFLQVVVYLCRGSEVAKDNCLLICPRKSPSCEFWDEYITLPSICSRSFWNSCFYFSMGYLLWCLFKGRDLAPSPRAEPLDFKFQTLSPTGCKNSQKSALPLLAFQSQCYRDLSTPGRLPNVIVCFLLFPCTTGFPRTMDSQGPFNCPLHLHLPYPLM